MGKKVEAGGAAVKRPFTAISNRLRDVLGDRSIRALVNALGLKYTTAHDYFIGAREPSAAFLTALHEVEHISPLWVLTGQQPKLILHRREGVQAVDRVGFVEGKVSPARVPLVYVPVFDVGGGYEQDWTDGDYPTNHGHAEIPAMTLDPNAFACILHGDSMEPRFLDGGTLIFEPNAPVEDGDFALVRTQDFATFKQVFFVGEQVRAVPLNRRYPELTFDQAGDQIVELVRLAWHSRRY